MKTFASLGLLGLFSFALAGCGSDDSNTTKLEFSSTPVEAAKVGESYRYDITVTPESSDSYTIDATGLPDWLDIEYQKPLPVTINDQKSEYVLEIDGNGNIYGATQEEGIFKTNLEGTMHETMFSDYCTGTKICLSVAENLGNLFFIQQDNQGGASTIYLVELNTPSPQPSIYAELDTGLSQLKIHNHKVYALSGHGVVYEVTPGAPGFPESAMLGNTASIYPTFGFGFDSDDNLYLGYLSLQASSFNKFDAPDYSLGGFVSVQGKPYDIEFDDGGMYLAGVGEEGQLIYRTSGGDEVISSSSAKRVKLTPSGDVVWIDYPSNNLMKLGSQKSTLVGTPTINDVGEYPITLELSSGEKQTFTITVTANEVDTFSVSGDVNNLEGSVMLQNNNSELLPVTKESLGNVFFTFTEELAEGESYDVSVFTSPEHQTCSITSGGSGTIEQLDITQVVVDCSYKSYTIGGTISGLSGSVVLRINGAGEELTVSDNGSFTFENALTYGAEYSVGLLTQPDGQTCELSDANGTVAGKVTNVSVTCSNAAVARSLDVTVTGLPADGTTVPMRDYFNSESKAFAVGTAAFTNTMQDGETFDIRILSQPSGYSCSITGEEPLDGSADGYGTISGDLTITVTCTAL